MKIRSECQTYTIHPSCGRCTKYWYRI